MLSPRGGREPPSSQFVSNGICFVIVGYQGGLFPEFFPSMFHGDWNGFKNAKQLLGISLSFMLKDDTADMVSSCNACYW